MIRVGVFGAGGRMGSTVCERGARTRPTWSSSPRSTRITRASTSSSSASHGTDARRSRPKPRALADAGADVAVDFTVLDAARENLRWCAATRRARRGRHDRLHRRRARASSRELLRPRAGQRRDRAELRDRRGADDAVRRARRARTSRPPRSSSCTTTRRSTRRRARRCRPRSASRPRRKDWGDDPTTHGRRRRRAWRARSTASRSTRCGCGAWSRTRRCCSARPGRACRSATTPTTARRSCPACCSPCARSATTPGLTVGLDQLLEL